MGGIKMKTTDKKKNKKQPELLKVLDQPMISQLNGGRDSKKDHKDFSNLLQQYEHVDTYHICA